MQFTYSAQKGKPGHCHMAQVFKDGKAFIAIEPTENEDDATLTAKTIMQLLNIYERFFTDASNS